MTHIVTFSGGKDSVAMALLLRNKYPNRKFRYVITPTGDELPEMERHLASMEKLLGPLTRVYPPKDFFELIESEKCLPNFQKRFCTRKLKINPFVDYIERFSELTMYVGLRADEENRVGFMPLREGCRVAYPLREEGFGIREVLNFLERNSIRIPDRTDCGACFCQRLGEWKSLLNKYPDRYEKYIQLEEKFGHTFRSPGRDTWSADLRGLREEFNSGRKIRQYNGGKREKCQFCSM